MAATALAALAGAVRESGLLPPRTRGVALVSGGPDSAGMLAGLVEELGADSLLALHLNYSLRPDSGEDERACRSLCELLGVELQVEVPRLGEGNVQAEARTARYGAAERLRAGRGLDWIATGHTRTDLAETLLYRLATSPGRRALLGLEPRRGAVIRPLLRLGREEVRELALAASLPFRDDPTNVEARYARNRIRNEVLPVLREIGPSAERVIAETRAELAEEAAALERLAGQAVSEAGADRAGAISAGALMNLEPAVRRLALRQMAERAAGRPVALGRERSAAISRLVQDPEGGVVELGGGVEARVEQGHVRFAAAPAEEPAEASLSVPGSCRFGTWEVRAELRPQTPELHGPDRAALDPDALGEGLVVRAWREGDRMRPLGLGGSKSLQDLFTDRKVPRSLRHSLPVVISWDRIAWIAGVAVSEEFAARPGEEPSLVLSASVID